MVAGVRSQYMTPFTNKIYLFFCNHLQAKHCRNNVFRMRSRLSLCRSNENLRGLTENITLMCHGVWFAVTWRTRAIKWRTFQQVRDQTRRYGHWYACKRFEQAMHVLALKRSCFTSCLLRCEDSFPLWDQRIIMPRKGDLTENLFKETMFYLYVLYMPEPSFSFVGCDD